MPGSGQMRCLACHSNLFPPYLGKVIKIKQSLGTVLVSKQICGTQILSGSIVFSCASSLFFLKSKLEKINYSQPECAKEFPFILASQLYLIMRTKSFS